MLSLSPTLAKRCADALETVARAPLTPIHSADTPRNLSALPPSIRALPADLQVVALCDMLADAKAQLTQMTAWRNRATDATVKFAGELMVKKLAHNATKRALFHALSNSISC